MAGLKAKSSSRESRFRKGGGGEGGVQQVEIIEQFFWIMRVGVTISRSLIIILKESLFWLCVLTFIFIGWSVFRFKSPENIEGSSCA